MSKKKGVGEFRQCKAIEHRNIEEYIRYRHIEYR